MPTRSDISEKILKLEIKKAARKAMRENIALGITTIALVNGNIVKIAPDKTFIIVKKLHNPAKKLTKKHFRLG